MAPCDESHFPTAEVMPIPLYFLVGSSVLCNFCVYIAWPLISRKIWKRSEELEEGFVVNEERPSANHDDVAYTLFNNPLVNAAKISTVIVAIYFCFRTNNELSSRPLPQRTYLPRQDTWDWWTSFCFINYYMINSGAMITVGQVLYGQLDVSADANAVLWLSKRGLQVVAGLIAVFLSPGFVIMVLPMMVYYLWVSLVLLAPPLLLIFLIFPEPEVEAIFLAAFGCLKLASDEMDRANRARVKRPGEGCGCVCCFAFAMLFLVLGIIGGMRRATDYLVAKIGQTKVAALFQAFIVSCVGEIFVQLLLQWCVNFAFLYYTGYGPEDVSFSSYTEVFKMDFDGRRTSCWIHGHVGAAVGFWNRIVQGISFCRF